MKKLIFIVFIFALLFVSTNDIFSQNSDSLKISTSIQHQDSNQYNFSYTFKSYNYHEGEAYFDPSLYNRTNYDTYQYKEYIENTLIIYLSCEIIESTDEYICESYRIRPELNFRVVSSDFCEVINQANQQKNHLISLSNTSTYFNNRRLDFEEVYSINIYNTDPKKPVCSIKNNGFKNEFGDMTEDQINNYYATLVDCSCKSAQ